MKALKKFVKFLLTKTSFIRIETTNVTDALKIFETINQRGKGLDSMDLLKNMIFRQVSRAEFKTLNSNWKNILNALEKLDEKPLRFLRYFIMANYDTSSEKDGILREDRIYAWICENDAQCNYVKKPFEFVRRMHWIVSRKFWNRLFIMPSSIRLRRMSPSALLFPGVPNSALSGSFRSLMHSLSTLSSPWLQTGNRTTCPISCGLV